MSHATVLMITHKDNSQAVLEIPIKLSLASAEEDKSEFHFLSPDGNRVIQKYVDAVSKKDVLRDEIASGYEYEKDKHVLLSKDELKKLSGKNRIEMQELIKIKLEPERICKTYYVSPDKSDRAYHLLRNSLKQLKCAMIGYWFTKQKDQLVAFLPTHDLMVMHQLYFDHEVREPKYIEPATSSRKELSLLKKVLSSHIGEGGMTKYTNGYNERLKELVSSKSKNELTKLLEKSLIS